MDDNMLFIQPCCVDKTLPKALMQAERFSLSFYTHGDVTMEKFYRAVAYLVDEGHVMVLSQPVVAAETFVFLQQCFERKWINALVLSTSGDYQAMVDRYLADYRSRVLYISHRDVSDLSAHLVFYNEERGVIIQGPMYSRYIDSGLTAYHANFYPMHAYSREEREWSHPFRNVLFPDVLRHRQQVRKVKPAKLCKELMLFLHDEFPPYNDD